MRKIIGKVSVINSKFSFPIMWDSEEKTLWLGMELSILSSISWNQVCSKASTADDALSCAQAFVDFQYSRY